MSKDKETIHLKTGLDQRGRRNIQRLLRAERAPLQTSAWTGGYDHSFERGRNRTSPIRILPSKHRCGSAYEKREVPVDGSVLSLNPYPIDYCPNCKVYVFGNSERGEQREFEDPLKAGRYVTSLQTRTNRENEQG